MSEEIKKGNTDMEALNDDLLEEASGGLASRNFFC